MKRALCFIGCGGLAAVGLLVGLFCLVDLVAMYEIEESEL